MKQAQDLYELFNRETGGKGMPWDDLPEYVKLAWHSVFEKCQGWKPAASDASDEFRERAKYSEPRHD